MVTFLRSRTPTVRSFVDTLRKAKADPRVSAVLLEPVGFNSPYWGKVQELRDAVLDFKASGKPVYAYLGAADDRSYYLTTAADRVFVAPSASVDLAGVVTYALFLRGTFDKFGIVPDMHHIGDYKDRHQHLTPRRPTRRHTGRWTGAEPRSVRPDRSRCRRRPQKTDAEVSALVDKCGPFLAQEALRAGLVDEIAYEDQAIAKLRADHGQGHGATRQRRLRPMCPTTSLGLDKGTAHRRGAPRAPSSTVVAATTR